MGNVLIDFLNDYYNAELEKIHDVAGNQHFEKFKSKLATLTYHLSH